jgi:hypothetical protein
LQNQTEVEDILSAWLAASNQLTFTVVIAGRISGGVFEDAVHKPLTYEVSEQLLVIRFEREECLSVFHPANISLEPDALLIIRDAGEARFAWYEYGRPHMPENLCEEIYYKVGRFAAFQRAVPRVAPPSVLEPFPATSPLPSDPFVQLVPG